MTGWQVVIDGAWPAARVTRAGRWTIRSTPGAGGRVNAISGGGAGADDVEEAEAAARALGQAPRFVIWEDGPPDGELDAALAARGYALRDACRLHEAPAAELAGDPLPHATAFAHWPPLEAARQVWAEGGIGPERQAVMARAARPQAVLARRDDRVAGAGFAAIPPDERADVALLSAIHVLPRARRRGAGRLILRAAAQWARAEGAARVALVVARDNAPANALYASCGMRVVAGYHYRVHPEAA